MADQKTIEQLKAEKEQAEKNYLQALVGEIKTIDGVLCKDAPVFFALWRKLGMPSLIAIERFTWALDRDGQAVVETRIDGGMIVPYDPRQLYADHDIAERMLFLAQVDCLKYKADYFRYPITIEKNTVELRVDGEYCLSFVSASVAQEFADRFFNGQNWEIKAIGG